MEAVRSNNARQAALAPLAPLAPLGVFNEWVGLSRSFMMV